MQPQYPRQQLRSLLLSSACCILLTGLATAQTTHMAADTTTSNTTAGLTSEPAVTPPLRPALKVRLPFARVKFLKGTVTVRRGQHKPLTLSHNAPLWLGDWVQTATQSKVTLMFSNGTRVTLQEKASLKMTAAVAELGNRSAVRLHLFSGVNGVFGKPKGNTQAECAPDDKW